MYKLKPIVFLIILIALVVILLIIFVFTQYQLKLQNKTYAYIEKGPSFNTCKFIKGYLTLSNGNTLFICEGNNNLQSAELYDKKNNKFIVLPKTNFQHKTQVYLFEKNNFVYIIDDNPLEVFDIQNNRFINKHLCVANRKCNTSTKNIVTSFRAYKYNNDNILIYAPYNKNKLFLWNYTNGKTINLPELNIARTGYKILNINNNRFIIIGGYNKSKPKSLIKHLEMYNPTTNKFIILPDIILDSEITEINYNDYKFKTKNFEYTYLINQNKFIKEQINIAIENYTDLQKLNIDNNLIFLVYTDCNFLICKDKTALYLKNKNKYLPGPELLYPTYIKHNIKINNNRLLFFTNYKGGYFSSTEKIKETQILNIR